MVHSIDKVIRLKGSVVFAAILLIVFYRLLSNALLSQMNAPLYLFPQNEVVYSLLLQSGLPQFVTGHYWCAALFDLLLISIPLLYLLVRKRIFAIIFTLLLTIYFLVFNLVTGHHYHGLVGAILITLPFWTKNEKLFELLWQGCRYYLLYIFCSAALWKIARGSVFNQEQLSAILQAQQLTLLLEMPDSYRATLVKFLISHAPISHLALVATVLLQLSFGIGFFTHRFDKYLLAGLVLFLVSNYIVMGIASTEITILALTLINWNWLSEKLKV